MIIKINSNPPTLIAVISFTWGRDLFQQRLSRSNLTLIESRLDCVTRYRYLQDKRLFYNGTVGVGSDKQLVVETHQQHSSRLDLLLSWGRSEGNTDRWLVCNLFRNFHFACARALPFSQSLRRKAISVLMKDEFNEGDLRWGVYVAS